MPLALALSSAVLAQTGTVVTVNADKVLVLNGRKVFPIGFSPGPPTNGRTPSGKDAMQELRDAGALLFRITQTADWGSQMIADQQAAMDWAAQHDMYCWLNLRELSKFAAGDSATEAELRSIVNLFKDHPALGLWKNFDEAWWGGVSAADLKRGYDVIKQEDANHPVVQTHAPRGTVSDLQPYNVATDVLALDIYPVGYPPGANSLLANKEISMVGDYATFLDQVGNGEKQYWLIEQIAWSGATPPGKTLRFPTFSQSRYMAYQAIINGARGLMFFGGNNAATLNPQDAPLGWNWTFWDTVLRRVVLELGDQGALVPALVATNSTLPITVSGAASPQLEFCVREATPYLYILASKREGAAVQVTFNGLPSAASIGELLYESPRTVTVQNGSFTDWFGPFEVHAYRFAVTNPPASEPLMAYYEPFNYPAGANLGGQTNWNLLSWSDVGTATAGPYVTNVAGNLEIPGLPAATGNRIRFGGLGKSARFSFAPGAEVATGTLYYSFILKVFDTTGLSSSGKVIAGFNNTTGTQTAQPTVIGTRVYIRAAVGGFNLGLAKNSSTTNDWVWDARLFTNNQVIFVVGSYTINPADNADDVCALWLDPDSSSFGSATAPAPALAATTGSDISPLPIASFVFFQRDATEPAGMIADELRIGRTWAGVTALPPPVPVTLTGVTLLGDGTFQFTYPNSAFQTGTVYASTDLTHWVPAGAATLLSPGLYRFTDPGATNFPRRFYQLRFP